MIAPRMPSALRDLGRNLASGALLVFGQSVTQLRFRIGVAQLLMLLLVSTLLDIAVDGLRVGPEALFTATGFVSEFFYGGLLLLFSAVLALAFRQPSYALTLPVVTLSGEWPLQVVRMIVEWTADGHASLMGSALRAEQIIFVWTLFWLLRSAAVSLAPPRPHRWIRAIAAAALLATPIWFGSELLPDAGWWETPQQAVARDPDHPSPVSETVLAKQPQLLYEALTSLEEERPGVTDLYFVGFAPYAGEDVFRKDMEVARDLFDERFDTEGRSVVLINNPRTVLEAPLATVSNLRGTLLEVGATINPDEDVVMLYITSHGSRDHRIVADFAPLELDSLDAATLKKMLDDAGIKWRIIVVSACYSGGFIDPLKDDNTLIITASAANRTSFGCGSESNATYFGDALFQHALRFEDSFVKAFERARDRIAERERAEKISASEPQMSLGKAMAQKLPELEAELRQRRSGNTI